MRRIDAFPCGEIVCQRILKDAFTPEQRKRITYAEKPLFVTPLHLIVSPKSDKSEFWLTTFERGLAKLKQSGRYQAMTHDFINGRY